MADMEKLLNKMKALEAENIRLRSLLIKAGIDFTESEENAHDNFEKSELFQSEILLPRKITYKDAQKFYKYFWGRTDVYSNLSVNKVSGKKAYYPKCDNFWKKGLCPKAEMEKIKCKDCINRSWTKLTGNQIVNHLRGDRNDCSDVVGIYPLFPDGTCRFIVFDFDNHNDEDSRSLNTDQDLSWINEIEAIRSTGREENIPMLVERSRSGRGAHIWIFFSAPVSAVLARKFGFSLLEKAAESVSIKCFSYYDRMLPAQDSISEGELGNLIALPLQGQALKNGNSAFIDEKWNVIKDQWGALESLRKLSLSDIGDILSKWNISPDEKAKGSSAADIKDDTKPWENNKPFNPQDVDGEVRIIFSNSIYIHSGNLKPRIQNQIRKMAAFSNPRFYRNKAIGISNFTTSRIIYLGEDDGGYICIPRGLMEILTERLEEAGIHYKITDERNTGRKINVSFNGELRAVQKRAVKSMLQHEHGILSAATAFGKTVVCSNLISQLKVNTLILLESSALIDQWEKSLTGFLNIKEEIPEYKTKTGLIRKRKSVIGIIQGTKDTSNGILDIAMVGSLFKKGKFHERLNDYGLVIMDECHHSASETVSRILREVHSKYVYGVTATPFRSDGMEKINEMYLGPIRFKYTAKEKALEQGIGHFVIPRFTKSVSTHGRDKLHINEAYEIIRNDENRNWQIVGDVKDCILQRKTPIVLTRFTDHAETLYKMLEDGADHVFLLTGDKSRKERSGIIRDMDSVPTCESMIVIATGQLIGEGFDFPRADTLIMAAPVAWKGIVEQYAGRLNRDFEGKEEVLIFDYIDTNISVFDNMYAKRLKAYRKIGYEIYTDGTYEKQDVNAIFDSGTYRVVYEKDLEEAASDIIISSPVLNLQRVNNLKDILSDVMEKGVRVTVVTLHPEKCRYGSTQSQIRLYEILRGNGINVCFTEEFCERYAVIDQEIVWYGSMNLLARDNIDDNIMRVVSRRIAGELLDGTFNRENFIMEYSLTIK